MDGKIILGNKIKIKWGKKTKINSTNFVSKMVNLILLDIDFKC
jgi:hypothetical protein